MSTRRIHLVVGGISVEVVRKDIKNLHVGVYPPGGRVRVAAPLRLDDEAVRLAVVSRLAWIRRRQRNYEGQPRQSERECVTGESHYFWGQRYRLDVIEAEAPPSVLLRNNTRIELRVRPGASQHQRKAVLERWNRESLRGELPPLLSKWQSRVGVELDDVRIRRMKTRWGSCNSSARRIWLNLELAKKPKSCIEYILVHEMVHFHERHHNSHFVALMDDLLPNWRLTKDELNRAPLAHEDWSY